MLEQAFAIKGVRDGLLIQLNPDSEWIATITDLAAHLDEKGGFYAGGGRVILDVGERPVPKYDLGSLKALLERRGLSIWTVISASETTRASSNALDLRIAEQKIFPESSGEEPGNSHRTAVFGESFLFLRQTIRSGQMVRGKGHILIYGDVNPGAEVIADGDILIWGRLRGIAHAGAGGAADSLICALEMAPAQLRIAGYIGAAPPGGGTRATPEVARVRERQIQVESWQTRGA